MFIVGNLSTDLISCKQSHAEPLLSNIILDLFRHTYAVGIKLTKNMLHIAPIGNYLNLVVDMSVSAHSNTASYMA